LAAAVYVDKKVPLVWWCGLSSEGLSNTSGDRGCRQVEDDETYLTKTSKFDYKYKEIINFKSPV